MSKSISVVSSSISSIPPYAFTAGLLIIPSDVLKLILMLLDPVSFNMAQRSCKALQSSCRSMKDYPVQFKCNYKFCLEAAKQGHLGILKWFDKMQAQQNKTEKRWDEKTCIAAAQRGHLEILQWLRKKDCPWDAWTCARAARNSHLHVLQWARQNDCPWDAWTCASAAFSGHLHVLQWARQNSCPWNKNECLSLAKSNNHSHIVQWIEENHKAISSPSS